MDDTEDVVRMMLPKQMNIVSLVALNRINRFLMFLIHIWGPRCFSRCQVHPPSSRHVCSDASIGFAKFGGQQSRLRRNNCFHEQFWLTYINIFDSVCKSPCLESYPSCPSKGRCKAPGTADCRSKGDHQVDRPWQVGGIHGRSADLLLHCVFDVSSGGILVCLGLVGEYWCWRILIISNDNLDFKLERIGMLGKSSTLIIEVAVPDKELWCIGHF